MSAIGSAASWKLTPKNRSHLGHTASSVPVRPPREESGLHLALKTVIGTTTSSANAFDADTENDSFVYCAGPSAILSRVDDHCDISQQLFRARESAPAVNSTSSFYNPSTPPSTPCGSRQGSPFKNRSYRLGPSVSHENARDSPTHGRANTRTREATSVSLGPEGQLIAIGETGYNPRVLLFSTAPDAPSDVPLSALTDHSFGVACVAFSHDSRWLCTVGNCYDGFILIYSINAKTGLAKLHSSNKCSNINCVVWMGQSVVSIGIRHVKVWRLDRATQSSPSKTRIALETSATASPDCPIPKTLSGRNCLLGALIDATFSAAVALSDTQAILCTTQGDVCLLDDRDRTQRLSVAAKLGFCIGCVTIDRKHGLVWVAGEGSMLRSILLDDLVKPMASPSGPATLALHGLAVAADSDQRSDTLAIGILRNGVVTIDSARIVQIRAVEEAGLGSHLPGVTKRLPAHESAVLGVRSLLPKPDSEGPDFLTFSKKGTVMFWMLDGTCTGSIEIPLKQPNGLEDGIVNELKVVTPSVSDDSLVSGDKSGVIRLTDRSGNQCSEIQAHSGDINGIATAKIESLTIVASCGRDRTLQVFHTHDSQFEILQTLDDHAATVTDLMFMDEASTLLSISSDRTIVVRKLAYEGQRSLAYLPVRVITLKASPISFTRVPDEPNVVVVSTMDRQIQRYDVSSARLLHSFKASDFAGCETVMVGSLVIHKVGETENQTPLLAGVSSTDKSVRIHDYVSGLMLTKEHGQKAVSAITLIQELRDDGLPRITLVSCGLDSTIMIYELYLPKHPANTLQGTLDVTPSLSTKSSQPLRRILSKAEISSFQECLEGRGNMVTQLRSTSPSRVRRKTSTIALASTPKCSAPTPTATNARVSPANGRFDLKSSLSSTGSSPQMFEQSRGKRPSLDNSRRSKSAANHDDLNDAAERICKSLRVFRKRITSAAMEKIDAQTARELESEFILTTRTIDERAGASRGGSEKIAGDLLDVYLAKLIDERLALKKKSDEERQDTKETSMVPGDEEEDQNNTTAGAKGALGN